MKKYLCVFIYSTLLLTACGGGGEGGGGGGSSGGGGATNPPTSPPTPTPTPPGAPMWVASWATAPINAKAPGGTAGPVVANQTIRQIVKPTVGSRGSVRLHFSNFFGDKPVTIAEVHIAQQGVRAAVSNDTVVTFGGKMSVTIPAHSFATSDTVSFSYSYGATLAITEYIPDSWSGLTHHRQGGGIVTSYATAQNAGNKTSDVTGASFTGTTMETFLLDRVDVYGDYKGTVATFGSSTTDGAASTTDRHMTYPEQLAKALHDAGRDDIAVANAGISGNELLTSGESEAGVTRFSRDVLSLPGLYAVIDYLGANDLRRACISANKLATGKQNIAQQANNRGVKYYLASIPPSTFCQKQSPSGWPTRFQAGTGQEAQRFAFNAWVKSRQASVLGSLTVAPSAAAAIIDFDSALADPSNPSYLLPQYDSHDNIHPNDAGYGALAKKIPLSLF